MEAADPRPPGLPSQPPLIHQVRARIARFGAPNRAMQSQIWGP